METVKIPEGVQVKLNVTMSSDAIIGANIRLRNEIKSYQKNIFTHDLGDISILENEKMTIQSLFHVDQNIDQIMRVTQVIFEISYGDQNQKLTVKKKKIYSQLFVAYAYVKFTKL